MSGASPEATICGNGIARVHLLRRRLGIKRMDEKWLRIAFIIAAIGVITGVLILMLREKAPDEKRIEFIPSPTSRLQGSATLHGDMLLIFNSDSFDSVEVQIEIDGEYKFAISRIPASRMQILDARQFVNGNGEALRPQLRKPNKLSICGETPRGRGCYISP